MQYYSVLKRDEILVHASTWLNLQDIMLSEINQIQKNKILHDSTYMGYLAWSTA